MCRAAHCMFHTHQVNVPRGTSSKTGPVGTAGDGIGPVKGAVWVHDSARYHASAGPAVFGGGILVMPVGLALR
jgi:hypothetical protein